MALILDLLGLRHAEEISCSGRSDRNGSSLGQKSFTQIQKYFINAKGKLNVVTHIVQVSSRSC